MLITTLPFYPRVNKHDDPAIDCDCRLNDEFPTQNGLFQGLYQFLGSNCMILHVYLYILYIVVVYVHLLTHQMALKSGVSLPKTWMLYSHRDCYDLLTGIIVKILE